MSADKNQVPFVITFRRAVLDSDLAPVQKLVALAMSTYANDDGTNVWPAMKTIAIDCGVILKTVRRTAKTLRAAGWLGVDPATLKGGYDDDDGRPITIVHWLAIPENFERAQRPARRNGRPPRVLTTEEPPPLGNPRVSKTPGFLTPKPPPLSVPNPLPSEHPLPLPMTSPKTTPTREV